MSGQYTLGTSGHFVTGYPRMNTAEEVMVIPLMVMSTLNNDKYDKLTMIWPLLTTYLYAKAVNII